MSKNVTSKNTGTATKTDDPTPGDVPDGAMGLDVPAGATAPVTGTPPAAPPAPPETPPEPPVDKTPKADEKLRQGEIVLCCPYHGLRLVARRTEPAFTRYYCPDRACKFSQKVPRPNMHKIVQRQQALERQEINPRA